MLLCEIVISYLCKNTSKVAMNTAVPVIGNILRAQVTCKFVNLNPDKINESVRKIDPSLFDSLHHITQNLEN